jgi:hypothetical protein
MRKLFKVGDVCIGQNFVRDLEYNGMECVVVGGLEVREWYRSDTGEGGCDINYLVRWENGEVCCQQPFYLRAKQPPRHWLNEVVSWETVGWMPMDVKLDRAIKQALKDQVREKA